MLQLTDITEIYRKVPNNYHIEYDGHYYSVLYSYCGKPAILKATASEIRICDQYNRCLLYTSDPRPAVPHDRVMARIDAIIEAARRRQQDPKGEES